ncbi:MAG: Na+/H+ antiporter NhaA [Polyangiales bacterium]
MAAGETRPTGVRRVVFRLVAPFERFLRTEFAGASFLVGAAVIAVVWANGPWAGAYARLVELPVGIRFGGLASAVTLRQWVNDVAMSLFFLVAGMEIRRELSTGELRTPARAALPAVAALGGMLAPAGLYFLVARGTPAAPGWGIPMATDIAFALGVLSLVRGRVPPSLLVFLTALAIFDDLGAIVVIAVFYGAGVSWPWLLASAGLAAALALLSRARVQALTPYALVGAALWLALHRAGVHPTLAGVATGLGLPPRPARPVEDVLGDLGGSLDVLRQKAHADRDVLATVERHLEAMQSPLDRMMNGLHAPVAFAIVPAFALLNAGVALDLRPATLGHPAAVGAALGLLVGKPVGITLATWAAVRARLCEAPTGARWRDVLGVAALGGVGFTMSLFVNELAFPGAPDVAAAAKLGVFAGSVASALAGVALLRAVGRPRAKDAGEDDVAVEVSA